MESAISVAGLDAPSPYSQQVERMVCKHGDYKSGRLAPPVGKDQITVVLSRDLCENSGLNTEILGATHTHFGQHALCCCHSFSSVFTEGMQEE